MLTSTAVSSLLLPTLHISLPRKLLLPQVSDEKPHANPGCLLVTLSLQPVTPRTKSLWEVTDSADPSA